MIPPDTVYAAPPVLVDAGAHVGSGGRDVRNPAVRSLRDHDTSAGFVRPAFEPIEVVAVEHDPAQLHAAGGDAAGGQRRDPGSVWRSRRHQGVRARRGVIAASRPSPRRRRPSARPRGAARAGGQCRSCRPIRLVRSPRSVRRLNSSGRPPSKISFQSPERTARCGARRSRARTACARSRARALRAPAAGRCLRGAPRRAPAFRSRRESMRSGPS